MSIFNCKRLFLITILAKSFLLFASNSPYLLPIIQNNVQFYCDSSRNENFEKIKDEKFTTIKYNYLSFGFNNAVYWIKLKLYNYSDSNAFEIIKVDNHFLEYVNFYITKNNKLELIEKCGANNGRTSKVSINLEPKKQYIVYISVQSRTPLRIPILFQSNIQFNNSVIVNSLLNGIYYGIAFFMFIFCAYIVIVNREKLYIYLMLTIFSIILFSLGYDNLFNFIKFAAKPNIIIISGTSLAPLIGFSYVGLAENFIEIEKPLFKKLFIGLRWFTILYFLLYIINYYFANRLVYIVIPIFCSVLALVSFYALIVNKKKYTRFFAIALLASLISAVIHVLSSTGIIAFPLLAKFSLKIGYLIQMIMFMLSSSERYIIFQRQFTNILSVKVTERTNELESANEELTSTMDELNVLKQDLEHKVAERTSDILKLNYTLKALIDASPLCIFDINENGEILSIWNKAAENIFGWNFNEVIGKRIPYITSQNLEEYNSLLLKLKSNEKIPFIELKRSRKDGKEIYIRAAITSIIDESGKLERIIAIIEDITERKKFEQKLFETILETEENERRRFAGDLHDELGPQLATLRIYISSLYKRIKDSEQVSILDEMSEMIKKSIANVREISNNLSPHVLENYGLSAAINAEAESKRTFISIKINDSLNSLRFDKTIETVYYRITKELLNNTIKYANATIVEINLNYRNNLLEYTYNDNGQGFNYQNTINENKGIGLLNIQSRIKSINGSCTIESSIGRGFYLYASSKAIIQKK